MSSDRLRREIESLLRGYYRGPLGPPVSRNPVLGAYGAARAQEREQGEPLPPDPIIAYALYHGWLRTSPQIEDRVYTTLTQREYLSGQGTHIPNSTPPTYQILWGTAASHQTIATCLDNASVYSLDWTDAPELDSDGSYPWTIDTEYDDSYLCTGEARGISQALKGSGRKWQDVLPRGWVMDPGSMGAVWSGRGDLYYIKIEMTSHGIGGDPILGGDLKYRYPGETLGVTVYFAKAAVPDELLCLIEWIVDNPSMLVYFDFAVIRTLIYAYASARESVIIEKHAGAKGIMTHADRWGFSIHPYYSWQFGWQPSISSPAFVAAVFNFNGSGTPFPGDPISSTLRIDGYRTQDAFVDIQFDDDGDPSITLTIKESVVWGAEAYPFWVPSGNGLGVVLEKINGPENTEVCIYKYTTADGKIVSVIKAMVISGAVIDYGALNPISFCGTGKMSTTSGTETTTASGGWKALEVDCTITPKTTQSTTTWTAEVSSQFTLSVSNSNTASINLSSSPYFCNSTGTPMSSLQLANNPYAAGSYFEIEVGRLHNTVTTISASSGSGGAFIVFLPTDSGVFIGKEQKWGAGTYKYGEVNQEAIAGEFGSGTFIRAKLALHYHTSFADIDKEFETFGLQTSSRACYTVSAEVVVDGHITQENRYFLCTGYSNMPTYAETSAANEKAEKLSALIPSNGNIKYLDVTDWGALFELVQGMTAEAPLARVSYRGDLIYTEKVGAVAKVPGGLSLDCLAGTALYPIGCA